MVKACIKACNLRHLGHTLHHEANRSEVVRLMERRQRVQLFQVPEHLVINPRRLKVIYSPMDHSVTDACQTQTRRGFTQERPQILNGPLMTQFEALTP